jgi:hypothetical protein
MFVSFVLQFHLLKQQQLLKQQRERQLYAAAAWGVRRNAAAKRPSGVGGGAAATIDLSPAAFPPLLKTQLQRAAPTPSHAAAAGMRAVFLTPPGGKRERNGTGVFLPRPAGTPAEPKKKTSAYIKILVLVVLVVDSAVRWWLNILPRLVFLASLQAARRFLSPPVSCRR